MTFNELYEHYGTLVSLKRFLADHPPTIVEVGDVKKYVELLCRVDRSMFKLNAEIIDSKEYEQASEIALPIMEKP
jgi:hypothetical protein